MVLDNAGIKNGPAVLQKQTGGRIADAVPGVYVVQAEFTIRFILMNAIRDFLVKFCGGISSELDEIALI